MTESSVTDSAVNVTTRISGNAGEPSGLVLDFHGNLCQRGCVLSIVMRAEQQFQAAGEQNPDISLSTAAITAIHGCEAGEELRSRRRQFLIVLPLSSASGPEPACAHGVYLSWSGGERLVSSPSRALVNGKAMASVVALPSAIAPPGEA